MENQDLFETADKYYAARQERDIREQAYKDANEVVEQLEQELIQKMTDNEVSTFKRNGVQFIVASREYLSANPETRDELYKRFRDKGLDYLFTVNANTLSGFVKEQKKGNEDIIPEWLDGLINTFEKQSIRIKK